LRKEPRNSLKKKRNESLKSFALYIRGELEESLDVLSILKEKKIYTIANTTLALLDELESCKKRNSNLQSVLN
jgi:hypothetical protein